MTDVTENAKDIHDTQLQKTLKVEKTKPARYKTKETVNWHRTPLLYFCVPFLSIHQ